MNDVPIQIRNPEVVRAIRELASRRGQPITQALGELAQAELDRLELQRNAETQRRRALIEAAVEEFNALPVVGPLLTDDDLYDEEGLPK